MDRDLWIENSTDARHGGDMHSQRIQEIYRDHAAALVLYARQWCCVPDDALQEAMLALAKCQPIPNDPVGWLYTATKRRSMNIARGELRRQHHQTRAVEEQAQWFSAAEHGIKNNQAESLVESVVAGLKDLAEEERELVVARVWGNLAFAQLGQLLGCSASSAHRRYQAALAKLRSAVEPSNDDGQSEPVVPEDHRKANEKNQLTGEYP
ncbi:MAG: sigma-70 family RNA polymerase sigma factor [Planctomycetales bacterium]|nr:sigma-70 family RNA polymerase sigma factor [Planctomycetales bacterium]